MRLWLWLILCFVCFSFGASLVLPFFTRKTQVSDEHLVSSRIVDTSVVGDIPSDWVVVERGCTWNRYQNSITGEYQLRTYSYAVNYNDSGCWVPIDTSFELLDSSHPAYGYGYRVGNMHGVYDAYFKPDASDSYLVVFAYNKSDSPVVHTLRMEYTGVGYLDPSHDNEYVILQTPQSSIGTIHNDTRTYNDVFFDTNIQWQYDNNGLKEYIIVSNDAKTWLQSHPPSNYGLSNSESYLVYITKLDYTGLTVSNETSNQTGNFTINTGSIRFKNILDHVVFTMPLGEVWEQNNVSRHARLTYRLIQYNDEYYILCGVKATTLNSMTFPVVFDPSVTLDYTGNPADIGAYQEVGARFKDRYYEVMSRWDISSLPGGINITNASYNVYYYTDGGGSFDRDLKVSVVINQTWILPSVAQYIAMSESSQTLEYGWNITPVINKWIAANVTWPLQDQYDDSNNFVSFRLEDADYLCDSTAIAAVYNLTYLTFGKVPALSGIPPADPWFNVYSREYATTSYRPWLNITYTILANNPPVQSNPSPANQSINIGINPQLSIYCSDLDADTMNAYWYSNSSGTWQLFGTNTSFTNGTIYQTNSNFSDSNHVYYWRINLTDTLLWDNETYWFDTYINPPGSFYAVGAGTTHVNLGWTQGAKSSKTRIECNLTSPTWTLGDGILVYNDTGTSYHHTGLSKNTTYYYQGWGWNNTEHNYSATSSNYTAITHESWWNTSFMYYVPLTINHSYIQTQLTYFPVLVHISNTDIINKSDNGNSIRFTNAGNTTEYNFEIETWNISYHSYIWVNVTIVSALYDTVFNMYYNNSDAVDGQHVNDTWNSGYQIICHMNDYNTSHVNDSKSNPLFVGNKLSANNPSQILGKAGYGQNFTSDYIKIALGTNLNLNTFDYTYELWAKPTTVTSDYQQMLNRDLDGNNKMYWYGFKNSAELFFGAKTGGTWRVSTYTAARSWTANTWYYEVASGDRDVTAGGNLYENGINLSLASDTMSTTDININKALWLGADNNNEAIPVQYFSGIFDELRMSNVLRNMSWLNASYHTMNASDFIGFGEPQKQTIWNIMYSGYLTGGNNSVFKSLFSGYVSGGNTSRFNTLYAGYISGGNTSIFNLLFSGYQTGGNDTVIWQPLYSGYISGGNNSAFKPLFTGWLTGGNVSSFKTITSGYLTGGNVTVLWSLLYSGYLSGGNTSVFKPLLQGYLTGGNSSRFTSIYQGYISGGNTSYHHTLYSGYLMGGNYSRYTVLFQGYVSGGNVSVKLWNSLYSGYLTGGNTTIWKQLSIGYVSGGNTSRFNTLYTGYISGGNVSTGRAWKSVFSGWISGGNTSKPQIDISIIIKTQRHTNDFVFYSSLLYLIPFGYIIFRRKKINTP